MILVTVGNHTAGFERLIRAMDNIASRISEDVKAQIGHTQYVPRHLQWFRFVEYHQMLSLVKEARVVVCHGGAGTITDAIKNSKPMIILPRLKEYGEAYDDHELELAEALSLEKRAILIRSVDDLSKAIDAVEKIEPKPIADCHDLTAYLSKVINQEEK